MTEYGTVDEALKNKILDVVGKALDQTTLSENHYYQDSGGALGLRSQIAQRVVKEMDLDSQQPDFYVQVGVYKAKSYAGIVAGLEVATTVAKALEDSGIVKKLNPNFTGNLANAIASESFKWIPDDHELKQIEMGRDNMWKGYENEIASLAGVANATTGDAHEQTLRLLREKAEEMQTRGQKVLDKLRESGTLTEEHLPAKGGHTDKIAPRNSLGDKGAPKRNGRE